MARMIRLCAVQKEGELHAMGATFFSTAGGSVRYSMIQTSADWILGNTNSPDLLKPFAGFVEIFYDKRASSMKSTVLVGHLVHMLPFRSSKTY